MRVAKKLEQETGKKIIHFEKGDQRIRFKNIISVDQLKENISLLYQFSKADCQDLDE